MFVCLLLTSNGKYCMHILVWFMVLNATFNNISVISWWSVLLVEETGVPRENHLTSCKSLTNFTKYCCIEYTLPWMGFKLTTLVVIDTDCTGSCKSNYHMIMTTMAPLDNACNIIGSSTIFLKNLIFHVGCRARLSMTTSLYAQAECMGLYAHVNNQSIAYIKSGIKMYALSHQLSPTTRGCPFLRGNGKIKSYLNFDTLGRLFL